MAFAVGAMSLASCSDDSSPSGGGGGNSPDVPLSKVSKPKPNPWLAQEEYSITHFNSGQTDAFSYGVKDGVFNIDLDKCQMTWSGPVNLMTLASTSPKYMWGMSSDRVSYLDISNGKLEKVAEVGLPGITIKTPEQLTSMIADHATYDELSKTVTGILGPMPQIAMANGNYVLCDKDNYVYTNAGQVMARYRLANPNDPKEGIVLDHQIRLTDFTFNSSTLVGASMTYDGHLIVAAQTRFSPTPSVSTRMAAFTWQATAARPAERVLCRNLSARAANSPPLRLTVHGKPITTAVRQLHASNSVMEQVRRLRLWAMARARTSWWLSPMAPSV